MAKSWARSRFQSKRKAQPAGRVRLLWRRRYETEGLAGLRDGVQAAGALPARDTRRGHREDHLPADQLPLRPGEDLHVLPALPRHRDQQLRGVADPQAAGPQRRGR
jgi:hypothetical protein